MRKGTKLSDEHKAKISLSSKGKVPWNKGRKVENAGEKHHNWKGGRSFDGRYWVIYSPNHHKAFRNRTYEHYLVVEKKIGRLLRKGEVVHHLNGDQKDNRPENLVVCATQGVHRSRYHEINRWARKHCKCKECGTVKTRHEALGLCKNCYANYVKKRGVKWEK